MSPFRLGRILALALLAGCASIPLFRGDDAWWAFTAPWDARSATSLRSHSAALDVAVTGWIALDSLTGRPALLFADTVPVAEGVRRFALVTSWMGDRFHPDLVRRLAVDTAALAAAANGVRALVGGEGVANGVRYQGVVLDLEGLAPADLPALTLVTSTLARAARAGGARTVAVAVPALDTAGYPVAPLLADADVALVMLYDEHWANSDPGPIASPEFVRRALGIRVAEAGASRLVAALPLYGYQWRPGRATRVVGWDDANREAGAAGQNLIRDPGTATLRARRTRDSGDPWELWVSDAALVDSLAGIARSAGIRTFALWHLGLEDPALWRDVVR